MKYNSQAHKENNHSKHSLAHVYSHDNVYLGEDQELGIVTGEEITAAHEDALQITYNSETGRTTVYGENYETIAVYENVYSQAIVIIGTQRII